MNFYVSIGEIQKQINEYRYRTGKAPEFPFILQQLYEQKQYQKDFSDIADTSRLVRQDDDTFLEGIQKLCFYFPDKIIHVPEQFDIVPPNAGLTAVYQFWGCKEFVHLHDCFEIDYIYRGQCELTFLDETRILTEGDFCILSPFTKHNVVLLSPETRLFPIYIKEHTFSKLFFSLLSEDDILSDFFRKILASSTEANYLLIKTDASNEIKDLVKKLFLESFRYDDYVERCSINWINLLFTYVLRSYRIYQQFSYYRSGPDYIPIVRYIQSHYKTITLQTLAEHFHYSVPYLSKIIKEYTGKNFTQLIKTLKIKEAIEYLEKTDLSIEAISEKTGYNSADHFYRIFKEYQGISPLQYRKDFIRNHPGSIYPSNRYIPSPHRNEEEAIHSPQ